jgi:hypothetical protein
VSFDFQQNALPEPEPAPPSSYQTPFSNAINEKWEHARQIYNENDITFLCDSTTMHLLPVTGISFSPVNTGELSIRRGTSSQHPPPKGYEDVVIQEEFKNPRLMKRVPCAHRPQEEEIAGLTDRTITITDYRNNLLSCYESIDHDNRIYYIAFSAQDKHDKAVIHQSYIFTHFAEFLEVSAGVNLAAGKGDFANVAHIIKDEITHYRAPSNKL